ncbi:MAG TPA: hypothetical protein VGO62_17640, partial [Myxococcota bacterium]
MNTVVLALVAGLHTLAAAPVLDPVWGEDLLAPVSNQALDQLYVLGFSHTGMFAYATVGCGDDIGYTCASAVIVDLATDRVVDHADWDNNIPSDAMPEPDRGDARLAVFRRQTVPAILKKYGIDARGRVVKQ